MNAASSVMRWASAPATGSAADPEKMKRLSEEPDDAFPAKIGRPEVEAIRLILGHAPRLHSSLPECRLEPA